jgi:hypothetical protein
MDEPQAPAETQDSPPQDTPAPDGYVPLSQYEEAQKRAADHQAWGTKNAQELAAIKQRLDDEEQFKQLLQERGYQVEEPDPGDQDPNAELLERIARIEAAEEQRIQQAQQAQQVQVLEQSVAEQFRSIPDLDEADREWVEDHAVLRLPPRDDGMPDIQGAYQALVERDNRVLSTRAKKRSSAPRFAPGGKEATQAPNLDDRQARIAYMAEQLNAMNAD